MLQVRVHDLRRSVAIEGILSGQSVIENAAHLVDVCSGVEFPAFELLRCHEKDRPKDRVLLIHGLHGRRLAEFGETEIEDLDLKFS